MMHDQRPSGNGSGRTAETGPRPISRGPQPGWVTLNEARDISFTGEIVFETEPEISAYLDQGVVYFAERGTDTPLGQQLVDDGLLDSSQLERGIVRVGEVEHLGRLFDRDPSVDRDSILVSTELATEMLVTELANDVTITVRSTAYRHHPSGVHRWFADQIDEVAAGRQTHSTSAFGFSVIDDIPGLPIVTDRAIADQLYIEWDEPIVGITDRADEQSFVDHFDESLLQAILDEAERADAELDGLETVPELGPVPELEPVIELEPAAEFEFDELDELDELDDADTAVSAASPTNDVELGLDDEFQVLWPNGDSEIPQSASEPTHPGVTIDELTTGVTGVVDDTQDDPQNTPVAEVPDDVADSVRRAIAALESATAEPAAIASIPQPEQHTEPAQKPEPAPALDPALQTPPSLAAFAPPSLDMSAEAIYARAVAAHEAQLATSSRVAMPAAPQPTGPASGVASVVFVDEVPPEVPADDSGDRSSALKRLIGGLRRKDR